MDTYSDDVIFRGHLCVDNHACIVPRDLQYALDKPEDKPVCSERDERLVNGDRRGTRIGSFGNVPKVGTPDQLPWAEESNIALQFFCRAEVENVLLRS